jgi:glycosyltransferase involved in cell wall biosynthesis
VDDGSTDDTKAVATSYPIRYLLGDGRGAASARNAGIAAARGDFITFLDDDDVWLPTNLAPQLAMLEQHPEYGAVHAQAQLADCDLVPFGGPVFHGPLTSGWIFDDLLRYWPQIGTFVVRKGVVDEVGYLDTTLCSEEEWDWFLRIARRYQIGRLEQPVMLFRQRGYGDEALAWRRLPDTFRVFHRHTRQDPRHRQIQRILRSHRGWFAANFVADARHYAENGNYRGMLRCLWYAGRVSPAHTLISLLRTLPLRSAAA